VYFPCSACRYPVFPAKFVEDVVFSSLYVLGALVKNPLTIAAWIYIWVFYSVPFVFMFVFVTVLCSFYYYGSVIQTEVRYCDKEELNCYKTFCKIRMTSKKNHTMILHENKSIDHYLL
jgi:predicted membrane protein